MLSLNQNEPFDEDNPKHVEERNNRKLTADKIRQILINVRNNPDDSSRRWIWELIQNAKDVPNRFGKVSMAVALYDDRVVFSHNGDSFKLTNLMSLVQQVSSKDSQNKDEKVTGKFGTGFISTHLLSDIIRVEGNLKHRDQYKKFELILDRKGNSSEELLPKISAALNKLNKINEPSEFPIVTDTSFLTREDLLPTKFIYKFEHPANEKGAKKGLNDLTNTLPVTLVNLPEVKKLVVENNPENVKIKYEDVSESIDEVDTALNILTKKIKITTTQLSGESPPPEYRVFLSYSSDKEVFLVFEINDGNLIAPPAKSPKLYRDFPLIGSHKFYFPFTINGSKFTPTEKRDGLILHNETDPTAIANRKILQQAFESGKEFTIKLIEQGVGGRHLLAKSRIPEATSKWDEEYSKGWIESLQADYRVFLTEQLLVETSSGNYVRLKEAWIPKYSEKKEIRLAFYDVAAPFIGSERVPRKDLLVDWIDAVGPSDEIKSWPVDLYFDLQSLIERVEKCETLSVLQEKLDGVDVIIWLQQLYNFLHDQREINYLASNAIVPNHHGDFKKVVGNELYKEDIKDPFDDYLLSLHKTVTKRDWKGIHIHPGIDTSNITCESSTLAELSGEINDVLKKEVNSDYSFLSRADSLQTLTNILRIREEATQSENFRFKLLKQAGQILPINAEPLTLGNIKNVRFELSTKLFIRTVNNKIASCTNLAGLATALGLDEQETITWLNEYLHLVYDNSTYTEEIKYGRIIPDQYGDFHRFEGLKDPGTDDVPIPDELIKALYDLDNSQDLKGELISRKVTIRKNDAYSFSELGTAIQTCIAEIQAEDAREAGALMAHKDAILDIIDWCGDNPEDASVYLKGFNQDQSSIFYKLTLGNANIKVRDIKLLENPENISILHLVNNSGISPEKISDLITNIDPTSVDAVITHAKEFQEEAEHKRAMLKIGRVAEEAILSSLRQYIPEAIISDPTKGRGSFDVRVKNTTTGKFYDLEIKSYAPGKGNSFLFAPSQAGRVLKAQTLFAVCLLQRPLNSKEITTDYVVTNLRSCRSQPAIFRQGYDDYLQHEKIQSRVGVSKLAISTIGDPRVKVDGKHLKESSRDFMTLINDIRRQIQ